MKKKYFKSALILLMLLSFLTGCMQGKTSYNEMKGLESSTITPQDSKSEDMNQNNIENSNEPLWAQPIKKHGQLFTGLNLDGIGDRDDEAYVSLYVWEHNGFGRYDASELVVQIRLSTGETDPFPPVVERLNTTGEVPILSADGDKLYEGSLILGTTIIKKNPCSPL